MNNMMISEMRRHEAVMSDNHVYYDEKKMRDEMNRKDDSSSFFILHPSSNLKLNDQLDSVCGSRVEFADGQRSEAREHFDPYGGWCWGSSRHSSAWCPSRGLLRLIHIRLFDCCSSVRVVVVLMFELLSELLSDR